MEAAERRAIEAAIRRAEEDRRARERLERENDALRDLLRDLRRRDPLEYFGLPRVVLPYHVVPRIGGGAVRARVVPGIGCGVIRTRPRGLSTRGPKLGLGGAFIMTICSGDIYMVLHPNQELFKSFQLLFHRLNLTSHR